MKIGAAEPASPVIRGHYPSRLAEAKFLVKPPSRARPGHSGPRGDPRVLPPRPPFQAEPGPGGAPPATQTLAGGVRLIGARNELRCSREIQGMGKIVMLETLGVLLPKIKPRRRLQSQPPQVLRDPSCVGATLTGGSPAPQVRSASILSGHRGLKSRNDSARRKETNGAGERCPSRRDPPDPPLLSVWGQGALQGNTASLQRTPLHPFQPRDHQLGEPIAPAGLQGPHASFIPPGIHCHFLSAPGTLGSFSSCASRTNKPKNYFKIATLYLNNQPPFCQAHNHHPASLHIAFFPRIPSPQSRLGY